MWPGPDAHLGRLGPGRRQAGLTLGGAGDGLAVVCVLGHAHGAMALHPLVEGGQCDELQPQRSFLDLQGAANLPVADVQVTGVGLPVAFRRISSATFLPQLG